MWFRLVGSITDIETIAVGKKIRELPRLQRKYGPGRWRKLKGVGMIEARDGSVGRAELHWYEAHGIGRRELKVKHLLD